jgi:hypothetical protein
MSDYYGTHNNYRPTQREECSVISEFLNFELHEVSFARATYGYTTTLKSK